VPDRHAVRTVIGGQRGVGSPCAPPGGDPGRRGAAAPRPRRPCGRGRRRASTAMVATGSGASVTLRPRPTTTTGPARHLREDARSFPVPTRTSLGHFRAAAHLRPRRPRHHRDTGEQRQPAPRLAGHRRSTPIPTDSATCDAGGVDQVLPCLPRLPSAIRRSAPRRRRPHLRRPAPTGRRWWTPSR
jgi:hypothetical protein